MYRCVCVCVCACKRWSDVITYVFTTAGTPVHSCNTLVYKLHNSLVRPNPVSSMRACATKRDYRSGLANRQTRSYKWQVAATLELRSSAICVLSARPGERLTFKIEPPWPLKLARDSCVLFAPNDTHMSLGC